MTYCVAYHMYLINSTINISTYIVHPVINVRNQLVGSPFEKDVTIECNVEASPKSINYWIKDTGKGTPLYIHLMYTINNGLGTRNTIQKYLHYMRIQYYT